MVLGDVQAHRGLWAHREQERQLRRPYLHGHRVQVPPGRLGHHHLDHRLPRCCRPLRSRTPAARSMRLQHQGRGGLAVGAGDGQPRRSPRRAQSPGELQLTPDRDAAALRRPRSPAPAAEPGRDDQQVHSARAGSPSPSRTVAPSDLQDLGALDLRPGRRRRRRRLTRAPRDSRASAAANPATPMPGDHRPAARSSRRARPRASRSRVGHSLDPLRVEQSRAPPRCRCPGSTRTAPRS